ncbi:hypothetical protein BWI15_13215 [Kribbella sp. ALI-6-A]|uniref:DUF4037 domain-containing protein n=1 Tax=Kribbella sp. ALI-6-A TaxID=1933817 RepID=UPI00097C97C9|nr:DUF4037 domain-containing protein [Kribbella sp. ALI-6-A]ONI74285.1 hypothetical protein BWI15_13215 [Kribbella sp. ALI-6-A]
MSAFVSGVELSARFYRDAVRPVLESAFPGLPHAAALMGRGSEVLGFDDAMSTDHDWKPRVLLFLREEDEYGDAVRDVLRQQVPSTFADRPTDFTVHTVQSYFQQHLGIDPAGEIHARDWLTFSEQSLRMVTAGAVHHDEVGLRAARERFAYYPYDVWLYLQFAGWWRIHPELNLAGRAGHVGDELGSALIGARLVQDLMRLCFLLERQYAPYAKWFGTAFNRLPCAPDLGPVLSRVLRAESWQEREQALLTAYELVGERHNALGITSPVTTEVIQMWDRPFKVRWGPFPEALTAKITDPAVLEIARQWPVGGVDQVREILWSPAQRSQLLALVNQPFTSGGGDGDAG